MLNKGAARGITWLLVFGPPVKMFAHPCLRISTYQLYATQIFCKITLANATCFQ